MLTVSAALHLTVILRFHDIDNRLPSNHLMRRSRLCWTYEEGTLPNPTYSYQVITGYRTKVGRVVEYGKGIQLSLIHHTTYADAHEKPTLSKDLQCNVGSRGACIYATRKQNRIVGEQD